MDLARILVFGLIYIVYASKERDTLTNFCTVFLL